MEKTNDNLTQPAQDRFKLLREYAVITAGLFLAALAIYFFMMPSNIIFGSITGLAMVLVHFIPVSVSVMTFILNLFCLVIGFVFVGKEFGAKTVYTSLLLPVFLPFNLLKAGLNAALTFVLYRPAVSALGRSGLIPRAGQFPRRHPAGPLLAAGLAAVTCVLLILSMNGTI